MFLQYRKTAKDLIDWICDYYARVESLPVRSEVEPGYLPPMLPTEAPESPESAEAVLSDIQSKIMPGQLLLQLLQPGYALACSNVLQALLETASPTVDLKHACYHGALSMHARRIHA